MESSFRKQLISVAKIILALLLLRVLFAILAKRSPPPCVGLVCRSGSDCGTYCKCDRSSRARYGQCVEK